MVIGFLRELLKGGPGKRVEEVVNFLIDMETGKVKYFLANRNKYKNYLEYCKSRSSIVSKNPHEIGGIEDWINFETILRVFRKIGKKELIEYQDFNYKNEVAGTRVYNDEIGHIIIESFIDENGKRIIEVYWQDEYTI